MRTAMCYVAVHTNLWVRLDLIRLPQKVLVLGALTDMCRYWRLSISFEQMRAALSTRT
jgi:hypothetical protein